MRTLWMVLICIVLILGMAGCQPASLVTSAPDTIDTQPVAPASTTESVQAQTPTPAPPAEATLPATAPATDEGAGAGTGAGTGAVAQTMVDLAKEHLAQRLGITMEQISLLEVNPVVWRDASLGCPKPAIDYIQVETPGYNIFLETGGKTYYYHTDEVNRVVPCDTP